MSDKIINEISLSGGAIGPKLNKEFENSPEVADIRRIFGANANIEKNEDGWGVRVQLADATCSGGQVVETELVKRSKGSRTWFEAKDLRVEGVSLPEVFKNNFVFKVPTEAEDITDSKVNVFDPLRKFLHTRALDTGQIEIYSLEDGDGLASVFHEIGHTRDKTPSMFISMHVYTVNTYLNSNGQGYDDISEIKKDAESILNSEMTAHKFAIRSINLLRSKGNDVFKDDEDLFRLKKFLVTTTIARFKDSPKFVELVGRERINQILEL